ncbi:hypothetical protein [Pseudarthrobacter phenanthrenivorans]|uniref:Uncharacterized protein n=1 Tax=Pseudarthrobacter phenanthrenivorans TaxID=361575 RepID=A0A0B4DUS8_PSEPS|nr:hypothetical protein [Pseudarthrobacter phenanthrenivorans]KIC68195.1 hypothetical protein RM50_05800 [Pseudarthrobacter phenanthrenivorans]
MKFPRILVAACLLSALPVGPAHAGADTGPARDNAALGNDISWPQCGADLPDPPAFAIVGVNGGRPDTVNPCLAAQLAWGDRSAESAAGKPAAVYVNTAATGPVDSLWWPGDNTYRGANVSNPYGSCDGSESPACAYVHGYATAGDDVAILKDAGDPARRTWWLDVETGNSWLWNKAINAAELEGMAAYLQGIGVEVGIYSTAYQFGEIVGDVGAGSNLYRLASWLAGAESTASAREYCGAAPLTGGGVVTTTQFTEGDLDYNYKCPVAAPEPAPQPAPEPAGTPGKTRARAYAELHAAQIS